MKNTQITQLSSLGNIDLIGNGVTQFLDGQLSINTNSLKSDTAKLACFCNHKGRIVALFHIFSIENGVRLILPKFTMAAAEKHIKKYAVFFKVEALSNTTKLFVNCCKNKTEKMEHQVEIEQTELLLSFDSGDDGQKDDLIWFDGLISKKIPWLIEETVEHFLPHNLNLPELNAVDFKKGCFTGQEVIARMQYKGKLKQHLQCLSVIELDKDNKNNELAPKTQLLQDGLKVGEIVCSSLNCANIMKVLAIIKDSANLSQQFQTTSENSPILEISS